MILGWAQHPARLLVIFGYRQHSWRGGSRSVGSSDERETQIPRPVHTLYVSAPRALYYCRMRVLYIKQFYCQKYPSYSGCVGVRAEAESTRLCDSLRITTRIFGLRNYIFFLPLSNLRSFSYIWWNFNSRIGSPVEFLFRNLRAHSKNIGSQHKYPRVRYFCTTISFNPCGISHTSVYSVNVWAEFNLQ